MKPLLQKCRPTALKTVFALALLSLATSIASSAPGELDEPSIPRVFSRDTVQQLIEKIEVDRNASILKVGFFAPRRLPAMSKEEGYALLLTTQQKEQANSRRWFILQSVRAFAALRIGEDKRDEGVQAYSDLFDKAAVAEQAGAKDDLQRAIYEFVATIPTNYLTRNGSNPETTKAVLLKSLQIHLNSLEKSERIRPTPPWAEALAALKHDDPGLEHDKRFIEPVEKLLRNTDIPKTYPLIALAAAVYAPVQPHHAIDLLQKGKPLLLRDDSDQVRSYYDTLVDLLVQNKHLKEAAKLQQERVESTGQGYGVLIRLQMLNKDEKAVQAVINTLLPTADEADITEVAQMLVGDVADQSLAEAKGDTAKQYAEQGVSLLNGYLTVRRKRDVEQELRARLILARYYVSEKKPEEAKQVLVINHLQPPILGSKARLFYDGAKRMLAKFEGATNKP